MWILFGIPTSFAFPLSQHIPSHIEIGLAVFDRETL